ncbi:MAG: glycosyltransferase family 4 protein [Pirellulales bacterium]
MSSLNFDLDPEVYVTNFHKRFTGVSATADAVISKQLSHYALKLVGLPLPSLTQSCSYRQALKSSRRPPSHRPFVIWHVRRNMEMAAAIFARDYLRLPIKTVFTSAAQRLHSYIPRQLISRMDAVVATTASAAKFVPHVAAVVPHGVDIYRFTPAVDRNEAWKKLGLQGRFGIGIVGRIRPEKGTDLFVETMLRVLPERPDFTAVIIGRAKPAEAEFEKQLRQQLAAAGLSDRVVFRGEVPPRELPQVLRSLSLLVAPPRYEGFGMTPLEAMASGLAVVATDTGVFRQVIEDGETGFVVGIDQLDQLTEAVLKVTADPNRLHEMGLRAREVAVNRLSLDREFEGYAAVYQRLWNGEKF